MKLPNNATLTTAVLCARMLVVAFQPASFHRPRPSLPSSPAPFVADQVVPHNAVIDNNAKLPEQTPSSFVSPSMQVYIEDTDAYGVMYNANYLRAYERALHKIPSLEGALADPRWFVLRATQLRFKMALTLGDEFVVAGELVERNGDHETWKCEMMSRPKDHDQPKLVYHTALITAASSTLLGAKNYVSSPPFDDRKGSTVRSTYEAYHDEFYATLPHHMPIRNVLNLFERARSDCLGGPNELRKMVAEDGILWVVSGVDSCELCNVGDAAVAAGWDEEEEECRVQCMPGDTVTVKTTSVARRGGMVVECKQTLLVSTYNKSLGECRNRRLAQGVTTIVALDAKSRRPTRKIPARVLEMIPLNEELAQATDGEEKEASKPKAASDIGTKGKEKFANDKTEAKLHTSTTKDATTIVRNDVFHLAARPTAEDAFPWDKCYTMCPKFTRGSCGAQRKRGGAGKSKLHVPAWNKCYKFSQRFSSSD